MKVSRESRGRKKGKELKMEKDKTDPVGNIENKLENLAKTEIAGEIVEEKLERKLEEENYRLKRLRDQITETQACIEEEKKKLAAACELRTQGAQLLAEELTKYGDVRLRYELTRDAYKHACKEMETCEAVIEKHRRIQEEFRCACEEGEKIEQLLNQRYRRNSAFGMELAKGIQREYDTDEACEEREERRYRERLKTASEQIADLERQLAHAQKELIDAKKQGVADHQRVTDLQQELAREDARRSQPLTAPATPGSQTPPTPTPTFLAKDQLLDNGVGVVGETVQLCDPATGVVWYTVVTTEGGWFEHAVPQRDYVAIAFGRPHLLRAQELGEQAQSASAGN